MNRFVVGAVGATGLAIGTTIYVREQKWQNNFERQEILMRGKAQEEANAAHERFLAEKDALLNEKYRLYEERLSLENQNKALTIQATSYENLFNETEEKLRVAASHIDRTEGGMLIPLESRHMIKYGLPSTENVHFHLGYVSAYDRRNRTALWSCEHLFDERKVGVDVDRSHSHFIEDSEVPEIYRAKLSDYYGSGYDRGHLTPAGDVKFSQDAMNETFLLSNISPQVGFGFNRHYWARLEKFARDMTQEYEDVYICSGPLYLPKQDEEDGKYYVKYKVIGDPPNVSVPTHFFKTILVANPRRGGGGDATAVRIASFILPNEKIHPDAAIIDFLVTTEELNRASGLSLWNRAFEPKPLCVEGTCKLPIPNWWDKSSDKDYPIEDTIKTFISSEDSEFHFPATLSSKQRKDIHSLAEKQNLLHESEGNGKERHVVLRKDQVNHINEENEANETTRAEITEVSEATEATGITKE